MELTKSMLDFYQKQNYVDDPNWDGASSAPSPYSRKQTDTQEKVDQLRMITDMDFSDKQAKSVLKSMDGNMDIWNKR